MHALGFAHEHQREDRDQYVECLSADSNNFGIQGMAIGRYDTNSIMHYPTNPNQLVARNLWAPYQRDHLSNGDKIALNKLYPPAIRHGIWNPRQGTTGLYYCGRHNMEDNNTPFSKIGVEGYCGPYNGPNCPSCRHYDGIQKRHNDEGREATQGETGLFYCGPRFAPETREGTITFDGVCGPNCRPCFRLEQ
jgi:hypothetical protein